MKQSTTIRFYDCTLRDGAQGPGINLSLSDKVRLARAMDEFGIDFIEGGWPGANPKDTEFFQKMRQEPLHHAVLTAFGATRRPGIAAQEDKQLQALLDSGAQSIALCGKASLMQVQKVLQASPEENLAMIADSIALLRRNGREVVFEAEHFFDGCASDSQYAMKTLETAWKAGAASIVLCDTNGATLPYDLNLLTAAVKKLLPQQIQLGIHCHNDSGCAVAGSLLAIRAGATIVQGTINGFGERCGNADLCSVMPAVALKMDGYAISPSLQLSQMTQLSRLFYELAVVRPNPQQPYVGSGAFSHKAGLHVNAVAKDTHSFEHIDPAIVGNHRSILLSEQAGASNVALKAREQQLELAGQDEARAVLKELKEKEAQGYSYEAADASFKLLVQRLLRNHQPAFAFDGFRVIVEKRGPGEKPLSEATIKVRVNGRTELTAAESSEGPVNALDLALRKALSRFFPKVADMQLRDFKVRIIDGSHGTAAQTRVLIDSEDRSSRQWSTVGVSENIIEASWQALLDSVEYYLQLE